MNHEFLNFLVAAAIILVAAKSLATGTGNKP